MVVACSSSGALVDASSGYHTPTTSLNSQLLGDGAVSVPQVMADSHSMVEVQIIPSKLANKKKARLAKQKELDEEEIVKIASQREERRARIQKKREDLSLLFSFSDSSSSRKTT